MLQEAVDTLEVKSAAFAEDGDIPSRYTCEGENINPPLEMSGGPRKTQSLAIIVEDPDAPKGVFDHWLLWNIPPDSTISADSGPGICGRNSFNRTRYDGPCPPFGEHRYIFSVYALDCMLDLSPGPGGSDKPTLLKAMEGHILTRGQLTGRYKRRSPSL